MDRLVIGIGLGLTLIGGLLTGLDVFMGKTGLISMGGMVAGVAIMYSGMIVRLFGLHRG